MNTATDAQLLIVTKKLSLANDGNSYRTTLPKRWLEEAGYPSQVVMVLGDIIIMTGVDGLDKAEQAAQLLINSGLMTPMLPKTNHRPLMLEDEHA